MLIQELEQKTGLPRATIRYYEREGFFTPNRLENGYRVYSQEDLDQLMKIHLLRELGMSLDTIRQLQSGEGDFRQALSEQMKALDKLSATAQRAKEVCSVLYQKQTTYSGLDAVFYLQELNKPHLQEPAEAQETVVPTPVKRPVYRQYHPVRRFLARFTDYQICYVLIQFLLVVVCWVRPIDSTVNSLIAFAIPFFMIPVEAFLLSKLGTTPGKWVYGLSVWDQNGYTLSFEEAKTRTWHVLKAGYGFGLPIYRLIRLYKSYMQYGGATLDWDLGIDYEYHSWRKERKLCLCAAIVVLISLSVTSILSTFNPKYRGELTVSEFAENYNFYINALEQGSGTDSYLKADGTFYTQASDVIYVGQTPTDTPKNRDFTYTTEDGKIKSIAYRKEYTRASVVQLKPEQCTLAAITMVMSQKGNHTIDLYAFLKLFDKSDFTESGSVRYENIEIQWTIESDNYSATSQGVLMCQDNTKDAYVKIDYLITVMAP